MSILYDLVKHYPVECEEDAVMQASAEAQLIQLCVLVAEMREALEKISNCPEFEDECYRLARAVLAKYPIGEEDKKMIAR